MQIVVTTYSIRSIETSPPLARSFPQSAKSHAADTDQGLPVPQRYWALLPVLLGVCLAVLDGAIANVALPTIAKNLHTAPADAIWIVNAYQLAITISLLPLSSLGDRVGYRRVFIFGLSLFTLASLVCAMSDSLPLLCTARVAQGFGAAGLMSVNGALVKVIFPKALLGRAIGFNASVVATASVVGPTIASGVLSLATWPWLFVINLPIGIAALIIGVKTLPRTSGNREPYDYLSALMNAAFFGIAITAVDGIGHGEYLPLVGTQLLAAAIVGYFFVRRQLNRAAPLLPVDLLKIPVFALSIGTSFCSFAAQMLALVALPFLMQDSFGLTQVQTGLLMTTWPLTIIVMAQISGRLADHFSAGVLGAIGLTIFALGLISLGTLSAHPSHVAVIWRMVVCGAGFGLFQSPNNRQMMSSAPRHRSGGASGMLSTARLSGQTTGAALVALLFGLATHNGPRLALFVATVFAVAAAMVSFARTIGRDED